MQASVAVIAQLIILILLPVVVFGSNQQAILAWLLMANLDASVGQDLGASATRLGLLNVVKGIVIPSFLAWQLREKGSHVLQSWAGKLWIVLTIYAAIAAFWSPFPLAAAKIVVNLIGILLTFIIFEKAGRLGLIDSRFLQIAIVFSLGLGVVQSYFLGGSLGLEIGGYSGHGSDNIRFTSFTAPNLYGALLVAFLAALFSARQIKWIHLVMMVLVVSAVLLTGSRVWLTGTIIVFISKYWLSLRRQSILILSHFFLAIIISVIALWGNLLLNFILLILPRLGELLIALSGGSGVGSVGTYNARQEIYDTVWQEMARSGILQIIFGHGTSSGGYLFSKDLANISVDVNRIFHDEWLRSLYEWGILGLLVFVSIFVAILVWLITAYIKTQKQIYIVVFSYLLALCLYIKTENIFAGAGGAVTMGFAMLLGLLWQETEYKSSTSRQDKKLGNSLNSTYL